MSDYENEVFDHSDTSQTVTQGQVKRRELLDPERAKRLDPKEYSRMIEILREVSRFSSNAGYISVNQKQVGMTCSWIDAKIGRENRLDFLKLCFHRKIGTTRITPIEQLIHYSESMKPLELFGLIMWAKPSKEDVPDAKWHGSEQFISDLTILQRYYGQDILIEEIKQES